ncbi:MAG: CBS domain-containing protein [Xenococcaceae cyanobacterium]
MDLILCHQTVDFDALGAAVGVSKLKQGAKIVLTGGAHPTVKDFLALYRDELALIEMRSVNVDTIRSLIVVDTQKRDRLGKAAAWFDLPQLTAIELYDHHLDLESDIPATVKRIENLGSITTLIAELLQQQGIELTIFEATAMALGIHVDTGSLTFDQTTPRDAKALAWLMEMGANVKIIAEYVEPGLSPQLQILLRQALKKLNKYNLQGYTIASVLLETDSYVPGLSGLTSRLVEITESDALLLGHCYLHQKGKSEPYTKLTVIGRSRLRETNLNELFTPFGGGGHSQAASVTIQTNEPENIFEQLVDRLQEQIPHPPKARDLMSSPVRTIRPDTTIEQAQRILFRYGHSGLSVVDETDKLVGIISRRDLDLALHHGFSHAPVKGYMTRNIKTITPDTSLPEIETLMVTYDVGRLPVIDREQLMGIVTRTDVLRQLHQERDEEKTETAKKALTTCLLPTIKARLASPIWQLLSKAAEAATKRGWHLYLVGGGVRDLLLTDESKPLLLQDIDLVVDGFHRAADDGAGVELANTIQQMYPQARLSIHGEFQTAALLWHKDALFGNLWIDIATARTEFYPYPAANPEVEASSIRQDLYRRDFTINALAVRLTTPKKAEFSRKGDLLDFFGGLIDLRLRQIRVLHANSFIEDPTRIYRAVRFATRLNFRIEAQTEAYIRYAIASGIYERLRLENQQAPALTTRLRAELKYILQADYWKPALKLLANLSALRCLHKDLELTERLWWQIRCVSRWLRLLDREVNFQHWLIRLEVLIASLKPADRKVVAGSLQLPKDSIHRLQQLEQVETEIKEKLPQCQRNSEIYKLLSKYKDISLIILAVRVDRSLRRILWKYLTKLSKVQLHLNGNDLKQLDYKPGPIYKEILDDLLIATIDGQINSYDEAKAFVKERY